MTDPRNTMTTYRVMAVQETGEEVCIASRLTKRAAEKKRDEARENYAEWSGFHLEREVRAKAAEKETT